MFKPKHTFQSVVEELIDGLESGAIMIGPTSERAAENDDHMALPDGSARDGRKPAQGLRIEKPGNPSTSE